MEVTKAKRRSAWAITASIVLSTEAFVAGADAAPSVPQWSAADIWRGPPYASAARCIGLLLAMPQIEYDGEFEALETIIATDADLSRDATTDLHGFSSNPTIDREKQYGRFLGETYQAIRQAQNGAVPKDLARTECSAVSRQNISG